MRGVRSATVAVLIVAWYLGGVPAAAQVRINTKPDLPGATVARSYSTQLVAGGGLDPYSFTVTSGGLPPGITLSPLGAIAGTPGSTGLFPFGVRVTDGRGETVTKQYRLRVDSAVNVVLETRVDTTAGTPLRKVISATGGAGGLYRISFVSGNLPPGVSFRKENAAVAQAILSGTPLTAGSYNAVFEAKDSTGRAGTAAMTFNVAANPARTSAFTLPDGTVGEDYEFDIPVQGFAPVRCAATATLPQGLALTAGCRLRGVPVAAGPLNLRATATDGSGAVANISATAQIAAPKVLTITTKSPLPAGGVGKVYRKQLLANGGTGSASVTPQWRVISGSLPPGLRLDSTDGTVNGTPATGGAFRFTVEFSGPQGVVSKAFDLAVGVQAYLWTTPEELGNITAGQAAALPTGAFQGGTPGGPPHLVSGAWPPGMAGQADGSLLGTPSASGSYFFILESKAMDGQVTQREFHVTVQPAQPLSILTKAASLPDAIAGIPYLFADYAPACSCAANNGAHPYRWQDEPGNLPPGLSLYADGELSGTPRTAGTYNFAILLSDGAGRTVSQRYTLRVLPFVGTLSLLPSSSTLPNGTGGAPYSTQFGASGGTAPFTYSASPIPSFLSMTTAGRLSSASAILGAHIIGVAVVDSQPEDLGGPLTASRNYDLFVAPVQSPVITRLDPVNATAGSPAIQLNVFGANFTVNSVVLWNGSVRPPTRLVSATQLVVTIPANLLQDAGVAKINVIDGTLSSNAVDFPILGLAPQLSQLTPGNTPAGSASFVMTVTGANFHPNATVRWNNAGLATSSVSTSRLTATVPATLVASAGSATVTVSNPDGQTSNPVTFVISAALPPQLSTLNPASTVAGGGPFVLTVNGANFHGSAAVRWNGNALGTTFLSPTQLTANVPANLIASAGSAAITVAHGDGQTTSPLTFTITPAPAPQISGLNPPSVVAGSPAFVLTVNGTNFVSPASVRFNGTPLNTTFVSGTQLTATVPPNLVASSGSANITVVNPDAQSSGAVAFTISPAPAPSITSLSPASAQAGGADFVLTVSGANFVSGSLVRWGGNGLSTQFVSANQVTANVTAGLIASAGSAAITVLNPDTQSSAPAAFTIVPAPAPQISSLSPSTVQAGSAGLTLTVNGSGYVNGSSVRWNGAGLLTSFVSATQLTASIAANLVTDAGTASVTVANPDTQISAPATFTIALAPAPQISSLSPSSAQAGGGAFPLTVNGSNFVNGSAIRWNGVGLTTQYVSPTQLSASIAATLIANAGTASVTVLNPDTQLSAAATFTVNPAPAPQISSLSPSSAVAGGAAFTLTVNGSNYVSGSTIRWNGAALTTQYVSPAQLTANIAANQIASAGTANVTVLNPDSQASSPATFTINPAPAPQISSLSPSSAVAGGVAFTLTVNGSNYVSGSAIRWNGVGLTTQYVSATQLTANIAANLIASAGAANVTVLNPDAQVSAAATFTINPAAAPQISSLSPSSTQAGGAAFTLTVNGSNYVSGSTIRWNGAGLTTSFISATQLTASIAANLIASAGTANVTVLNPDTQVSPSMAFTINPAPAPQISSLSPSSTQAGGAAFTLTVNGSNFVSGSAVRWNGAGLTTQYVSATQLTASVTPNLIASAGTANVTVANPDTQVSSAATFTINPAPPPQISSLSPSSAQAGGAAFTLTVNGSNYVSGSTIRWNGAGLTTQFVSATQLTASVGANLIAATGTATITVLNPDTQVSAGATFTINPAPAPQISSLNPSSAQAGGAGFTLTVNGANFAQTSVVRWNGTDLSTSFVSASQLTASVSPAMIAAAGSAAVTVANADGQTSAASTFTITAPPPQISSLSPASAQAGGAPFTLTVNGTGFQNNSAVRWNGNNLATSFVSATQLTASVAANLINATGTASVTVANSDGQVSQPATFTINPAPAPQVTSLSPLSAQAGSPALTLTVNGAGFQNNSSVRWNGNGLSTQFVSATQLTANVPANLLLTAGTANVTVANADGQTSAPAAFTISQPAAPQITSLNPASAQAGGVAFTLTVNGANFVSGSIIRWNGADLSTAFVSATQLTASISAALIAAAGSAAVTVANPDGQTASVQFSIVAPAPQLTSISPTTVQAGGPALTLTANGSGFQNTSAVRWNGNALPTTFVSATQLTAVVPASLTASAGTASITVANTDGQVSSPVTITITLPAPTISSLGPSSTEVGGAAFTLTVNGTGYAATSVVRWNGSALATTFISATQLTAAVSATLIAAAGSAAVTVANSDGQVSAPATFQIALADAPQISSLVPSSTQAGGVAFTLAINGNNFRNGAVVRWNGSPLTTTFVSATQLSAAVQAGQIASPGTAAVVVVNPDNQFAGAATFTITAPAPQITSITPNTTAAGGAGFTLTVNGSAFVSGAAVRWNGSALTTTFVSATQLTAAVAASLIASAGSASVTVANPDSQITAPVTFTVTNAAPVISSLSPSSAQAGGAAFTLTVNGSNFQPSAAVRWNGAALATTFVSATQLTAAVAASLIASAGSAGITVANTDGQTSAAATFTIGLAPAPGITSLSPSSAQAGGAGFTLTVNGSNFQSTSVVRWNGGDVPTTFVSATQLTAAAGASLIANAGTAAITVANPDGQVSGPSQFTITNPAPAISSLLPASTQAGSPAFTLTVNGSNFQNNSAVRWNGTALPTSFVSATRVTANVSANLVQSAGSASVTVANSDGQVSPASTFTITQGSAPSISSLNPSSATAGGVAFTLTVNGANFQSGAVVKWNGADLPTTFGSASLVTASVAANLISAVTTVTIGVQNPDGQTSANVNFAIAAQAPQISSLAPNTAQAGGAAFTLAVNGSFFQNGAFVRWGTTSLTTTYVSPSQLTASVPANLIATAGTASITVTNADGQISSGSTFTITQGPPPQLTSVNPPSAIAGGSPVTLTIQGLNFQSGAVARFNSANLPTTYVSAAQLTATVPANLIATTGSAALRVANPDGQLSQSLSFSIDLAPRPEISGLNPSSAAVRSPGFTLTVTGRNFQSGATVRWNNASAATTFVSATQLTADIPAGLLNNPGAVAVTVANPDGQTSAPSTFTLTGRAPQITTLTPSTAQASGPAFTLTIRGADFASGATARWNGNPLTTTFVSDSELSAAVTANLIASAGTAAVTVTNTDGQTSSPATFTITQAPAPAITSLTPNSAKAQSGPFDLSIQGANFQNGAVARWGGTALPTTYGSATQLTARVPANLLSTAGTVNVTVANPDSQTSPPATFTITQAPAPVISSLNPNSAQAGSPGFTLIVNGSEFQSGAAVRWNGTALTTSHISATQLSAQVGAALIASAGTAAVTVANPDGQTSSGATFTIAAQPPQITLLTPGSAQAGGAAFTLAVQGQNFQSGAAVRWNDAPLSTTFGSATQLSASVPANLIANAGTATIVVANPDGQNSAPVNFSIGAAPAPLITGLSPNSALAGGAGFNLTVQGANFQPAAVVRWNGTALGVTQTSPTQITVTVPANLIASVGSASIVVANPDGQVSTPAAFTIAAPPPQITSLNPASVPATTGTFTLAVNGSGFQSGGQVRWSGSPLTTTFVSATQLNATVPAALLVEQGTVSISVVNPDSQTSANVVFTIAAPPRPVIISVNPPSVPAGGTTTVITVNGNNFNPGSVVNLGNNQLSTNYTSSTQVTAVVPSAVIGGSTSVTVTVRNPDGQVSEPITFTITPPGPSLFSVLPASAQAGGPDLTLNAAGLNFRPGVELRWNSTPLATSLISATQISALVPASLLASAGTAFLTARNPDGGVSGALSFPVLGTVPVVTTLVPAAAPAGSPALTLVVTGDGFLRTTEVLWNGAPLATTFVGPTQVTAQVGADLLVRAGVVSVGVRNADGQVSNSLRFTISESSTPEITRLNPASSVVNAPAFVLTVTGTNFQPESQVQWNGAALATTFVSSTQLTANVASALLALKGTVPVTVRNPGGRVSQPLSFDIGDALKHSTQTLPDAQIGKVYKAGLEATGGAKPYRFSLWQGSRLPAGLDLAADGSLQGTPSEAGEFFFEIEVRDVATGSDRKRFRLLVADRLLEITNASPLPQGTAGAPYIVRFQVNETVEGLSWSLLDGELPIGLSLDPITGELTGAPAEPAEENADPRVFTFRIEASTGDRQARKTFELTIQPQRGGLRIATPSSLPVARVGRPYLTRIAAVGGRPPYTFALDSGSLPAGLNLMPDGGIEGTPRTAGVSTFAVRALDAASRSAVQSFTLAVTDAQGPQITSSPALPRGTPGQAYQFQIQASGGRLPYRWAIQSGALPQGLTFDAAQARIVGTPLRAGQFRFSVSVTDADNRSDSRVFDLPILLIGDNPLDILTTALPGANLGEAYRATFTATGGGGAPYRFLLRAGNLPAGLRLEGDSITGVPAELGTFRVGVRALDLVGALADRDYTLVVGLAALPAVAIGGVPELLNPGQQSPVAVDLSRTYPVDLTGRLDLDFTSEPFVQGVDPALQFSTGGRSVEFRVPAGQTRAVFPQAPFGLQTGTVAGMMRIRMTLRAAGVDVRPQNEPDRSVRIAATAPVISNASIEKNATGFNLIVTGFSPAREVLEGIAVLTPAAGRQIESTRLTIPLTGAFRTWYDAQASLPFGTQFRLVLPFTGDATAVESMTFVLRNQLGTSAEVKLTF